MASPLGGGTRTLGEFLAAEERHKQLEELRERGLTDEEIRLLEGEEREGRRHYGAHPDARGHRLMAIKQKLTETEKREGEEGSSAADLDKALNSTLLQTLSFSKVQESGKKKGVGQEKYEEVFLLPEEVIARHRLSLAEIRALPRFSRYDPGEPSKELYVKNIHRLTMEDDLMAIFGRFRGREGSMRVKMMKGGRMRGQAFVEFPSIEAARQALQLANGYLINDQPLIISYAHRNKPSS